MKGVTTTKTAARITDMPALIDTALYRLSEPFSYPSGDRRVEIDHIAICHHEGTTVLPANERGQILSESSIEAAYHKKAAENILAGMGYQLVSKSEFIKTPLVRRVYMAQYRENDYWLAIESKDGAIIEARSGGHYLTATDKPFQFSRSFYPNWQGQLRLDVDGPYVIEWAINRLESGLQTKAGIGRYQNDLLINGLQAIMENGNRTASLVRKMSEMKGFAQLYKLNSGEHVVISFSPMTNETMAFAANQFGHVDTDELWQEWYYVDPATMLALLGYQLIP